MKHVTEANKARFLAFLGSRAAAGEGSLKTWGSQQRPPLTGTMVEDIADALVDDGLATRESRAHGYVWKKTPTPPAAENKPEPADRDATVSPEPPPPPSEAYAEVTAPPPVAVLPAAPEPPEEPPEALPSFFRRCGALGASLLGQTLRCALDAGHGGAHGDGATLWWTDPAPEPSPTPPPVSGPREVEAAGDDPVAAVLARVPRELRHTLARLLIDIGVALAGGSEGAAHLTARAADREGPTLSENATKVLTVLPPPGEPALTPKAISVRAGINYNSAVTALRSLERHGLAKNPVYGLWRAA